MKKAFLAIMAGAAFCAAAHAATYDMKKLKISNVTTGATADTVTAQIAGKVERVHIVADASAGIDWTIKSAADGTVLYGGTNLANTAVVSSTNQAAFIGLTLSAHGANATNKNVEAVVIYSE